MVPPLTPPRDFSRKTTRSPAVRPIALSPVAANKIRRDRTESSQSHSNAQYDAFIHGLRVFVDHLPNKWGFARQIHIIRIRFNARLDQLSPVQAVWSHRGQDHPCPRRHGVKRCVIHTVGDQNIDVTISGNCDANDVCNADNFADSARDGHFNSPFTPYCSQRYSTTNRPVNPVAPQTMR